MWKNLVFYFILKVYRVCFGKNFIRDNFNRLSFLSKNVWIQTSLWEYPRGNECRCPMKSWKYSTLILTDGSPCSLPLWRGGPRWKRICRRDTTRRGATTCSMTFPFDDCNKWGPPLPPPPPPPPRSPKPFYHRQPLPVSHSTSGQIIQRGVARSVEKKSEFLSATWLGWSLIDSSKGR